MRCPYCHHFDSKVIDSRYTTEQHAIRRKRECLDCHKRFRTIESMDLVIQVHKKNGTYEDFQQEKLIRGIDLACRDSTVSHQRVLAIAAEITADLIERQTREIESAELGQIVMNYLKKLDTIAFIRFGCVYGRFKHMKELMDELHNLASQESSTKE